MLITRHKKLHLIAGAIATFNLLQVKLLLKNPAQAKTLPGRLFRNYMSLVGEERWTSKDIYEIFPNEQGVRVTLEHLHGKGVGTPLDELAYLAIIAKILQPRRIFEIGTFHGRTALNFALNTPEDCLIYTLDLPPDEKPLRLDQAHAADKVLINQAEPGQDYRGKDIAHKIVQLYGDSLIYDFSTYFGQVDLVFIDGAHDYLAVKSDTQNALKMVRSGGYILWHDFANYGDYSDVTRAILDVIPPSQVVQIYNTQLALYNHASST